MTQKFELLLTNRRRARWLWWALWVYAAGLLGLLMLRYPLPFAALVAPMLLLLLATLCYDWLFRQPGWAEVAPAALTWLGAAADQPVTYEFASISTYRFESSRIGLRLRLWLRTGEEACLDGSFNKEFAYLWRAFDQAVSRYNQANPSTTVGVEKEALTKFFEHPAATKGLVGLLAAAGLLGWAATHGWGRGAAIGVAIFLVPYLVLWANAYYERAARR